MTEPESEPRRTLAPVRAIVSRGIQLAGSANGDIRRGSIYFGLLVLGCVGPFLAYVIEVAAKRGMLGLFAPIDPTADAIAVVLVWVAVGGVLALGIEASVVALAVLGGHAVGSPVTLRRALRRSRQVFWRVARTWLLIGLASVLIRWLLSSVVPSATWSNGTIGILVTALLTAPLAYAQAAIVLGDAQVIDALRRSVVLTRSRLSYAAAITLFGLAANVVELFALSAGLEVVGQLGELVGVDLSSPGGIVVVIAAALLGTIAIGSLVFTIFAIQAGPQVVAFLELAPEAAGLARSDEEHAGVGFRWVTLPMAASILVGVVGIALAAPHIG